jgi:hypothetical protein
MRIKFGSISSSLRFGVDSKLLGNLKINKTLFIVKLYKMLVNENKHQRLLTSFFKTGVHIHIFLPNRCNLLKMLLKIAYRLT